MTIGILLRVGRAFRGTKQRLSQGSKGADACCSSQSPSAKKNISHTRGKTPRNSRTLRKRNATDARCVCWLLQNITNPKTVDSALPLPAPSGGSRVMGPTFRFREGHRPDPRMCCTPIPQVQASHPRVFIGLLFRRGPAFRAKGQRFCWGRPLQYRIC
jgi:hypothetical protein